MTILHVLRLEVNPKTRPKVFAYNSFHDSIILSQKNCSIFTFSSIEHFNPSFLPPALTYSIAVREASIRPRFTSLLTPCVEYHSTSLSSAPLSDNNCKPYSHHKCTTCAFPLFGIHVRLNPLRSFEYTGNSNPRIYTNAQRFPLLPTKKA